MSGGFPEVTVVGYRAGLTGRNDAGHQLDPDLTHPAGPLEAVARGAGGDDGDGHGVTVEDAAVDDPAGAGEAGIPAAGVAAGHAGALTDGMGVACRDDWSMGVFLPREPASTTP